MDCWLASAPRIRVYPHEGFSCATDLSGGPFSCVVCIVGHYAYTTIDGAHFAFVTNPTGLLSALDADIHSLGIF